MYKGDGSPAGTWGLFTNVKDTDYKGSNIFAKT